MRKELRRGGTSGGCVTERCLITVRRHGIISRFETHTLTTANQLGAPMALCNNPKLNPLAAASSHHSSITLTAKPDSATPPQHPY